MRKDEEHFAQGPLKSYVQKPTLCSLGGAVKSNHKHSTIESGVSASLLLELLPGRNKEGSKGMNLQS